MAITCTWSVNRMTHKDSDGGVIQVVWTCEARSDGEDVYTATESGKLQCEYDASSPTFIPYADLTEDDVLGWVYNSLIQFDETADEAKARVEAARIAKVQAAMDRANSQSQGLPWAPEPTP